MHVGKILVKEGDTVKRGQVVAEAGTQVKTNCGGGMEHLRFHMSKKKVKAHQEVTGGLGGIQGNQKTGLIHMNIGQVEKANQYVLWIIKNIWKAF